MQDDKKQRLTSHIIQMSNSLIDQIGTDGIIRTSTGDSVIPDIVASHHLVELLLEFNPHIFSHEIGSIVHWLTSDKNDVSGSQFTIDTVSQVSALSSENRKQIADSILSTQLNSGAFTRFNPYAHGGDYFSTLWCIKVLLNLGYDSYAEKIIDAVSYLLENMNEKQLPISNIGFLLYLLLRIQNSSHEEVLKKIYRKIYNYIRDNDPNEQKMLVEYIFLLEDLIRFGKQRGFTKAFSNLVEKRLCEIFSLEEDANSIPKSLSNIQSTSEQSLFYQTLIRACLAAYIFFSNEEQMSISLKLNEIIHSIAKENKYDALIKDRALKEFLAKYGNLHEDFAQYDEVLKAIWKKTPFEKSIFIMMPFNDDINHSAIVDAIKIVCKENDFKAIRVDDADRQFSPRLWDNLVINMLSCKYGIAVYVSPQIVNVLEGSEPKMFANPNVAIEFGFMKSRGQAVLLLRDIASSIPTDLQGFLWEGFDIRKPKTGVSVAVKKFLKNVNSKYGVINRAEQ